MIIYDERHGNLAIAKAYVDAGYNIIPLKVDGTKSPSIYFKHLYHEPHPWLYCQHYFSSLGRPHGIGILGGITSGNLEILDFDFLAGEIHPKWAEQVESRYPGLLATLPLVLTPSEGYHQYFRCDEIEGNQKLAQCEVGRKIETLIETRGQGGYVVAPGSPPATHYLGKPYKLIAGDILNPPRITPEQRQSFFAIARTFDEKRPSGDQSAFGDSKPLNAVRRYAANKAAGIEGDQSGTAASEKRRKELEEFYGIEGPRTLPGNRPGDDFNRKATWAEILEPHGWEVSHVEGEVSYWRRPGKVGPGISATTNYGDSELLYVFSSNATGFEAGCSYSKFAAFAILNHGGGFERAAQALADDGYGQAPDLSNYPFTL